MDAHLEDAEAAPAAIESARGSSSPADSLTLIGIAAAVVAVHLYPSGQVHS
jgi:hypothetical protein